jgi:hypothetical protein
VSVQKPSWPDHSGDEQRKEARLAQHEFRAMLDEILSGVAFETNVSFGKRPLRTHAPPPPVIRANPPVGVAALPPPLGLIAPDIKQADLVTAAILIGDEPPAKLGAQLLDFMTEHNFRPFLRPVFLCETMVPIPLLARYGFCCLPLAGGDPVAVVQSIAPRFGIAQLRALSDGRLIWSRGTP